ncbi:MAG: hypothetical protein HQM12_19160 [SAR324 cluster bacterium]|nr:hypothetical protein [SAR324 cluster bacterium]
METILLAFCAMSLLLSSMIVIVELIRDQRNHSAVVVIPEIQEHPEAQIPLKVVSDPGHQSGNALARQFLILKRDLVQLGYRSPEQQIQFINWILNSHYTEVHELIIPDLKKAFSIIKRYKMSREESVISQVVPQTA